MVYILNLETSANLCSVALTRDGIPVSVREAQDERSHATQLIPLISQVLKEAGISSGDLKAVAVSKGPGSYTGLRIGVSTAKGIAYSLRIPLISVDTLQALATGFLSKHPEFKTDEKILLSPMVDARRMEVYNSLFSNTLSQIKKVTAEIITPDSFLPWLTGSIIHFFGDGAMKCKSLITHPNAIFHEGFLPSSIFMGNISFWNYTNGITENLAYFEPFYLKNFVTTIPGKKQILSRHGF